jgi:hypothetical protein
MCQSLLILALRENSIANQYNGFFLSARLAGMPMQILQAAAVPNPTY